jgi:hypothetical protein
MLASFKPLRLMLKSIKSGLPVESAMGVDMGFAPGII